MKRTSTLPLFASLIFFMQPIAFANSEPAPYNRYCISISNTSGYYVYGRNALISNNPGGLIASFGSFNDKVCYDMYVLPRMLKAKASSGKYYISISGQVLASQSGASKPIYTPKFKCPNIIYPVWEPKEIEVAVLYNPLSKKANCKITNVIHRN